MNGGSITIYGGRLPVGTLLKYPDLMGCHVGKCKKKGWEIL